MLSETVPPIKDSLKRAETHVDDWPLSARTLAKVHQSEMRDLVYSRASTNLKQGTHKAR